MVSEVIQTWPRLGCLTTRLWRGAASLEVEWAVGPPPKRTSLTSGRELDTDWELFVRYSSDVASGKGGLCVCVFVCGGVGTGGV